MNLSHEQLTELIREAGKVDPESLAAYIEFADGQIAEVQYLIRHSEEIMGHYSASQRAAWDRWYHKMTDAQKRRW